MYVFYTPNDIWGVKLHRFLYGFYMEIQKSNKKCLPSFYYRALD